jgi:electron transfer flavoprotein alpha subunit
MAILIIADHDNQSVRPATLATITAAQQLDADVHVLVAGWQCQGVVATLAATVGVTRVLHADARWLATPLAENTCAQIIALLGSQQCQYSHILFAATASGKNSAPRLAAMLDVAPIGDVIRIIDADTFERPIYAGNAIATVRSRDAQKVITIRATSFAAAPVGGHAAVIDTVAAVADGGQSRFVRSSMAGGDRPELDAADIVVSGGRALASAAQFEALIAPLADKLGAAIGASRAAVDAGYASNDLQVGQTGKIVAPRLYVAVGISGAIQHLAGMKDADIIVAINTDPEAPIFGVADFALEADLFTVLPQITQAL